MFVILLKLTLKKKSLYFFSFHFFQCALWHNRLTSYGNKHIRKHQSFIIALVLVAYQCSCFLMWL